jgi:hypothetical protein
MPVGFDLDEFKAKEVQHILGQSHQLDKPAIMDAAVSDAFSTSSDALAEVLEVGFSGES